MKKSLLLLGAIFLVGCSTDSANAPTTTDCNCGVVVQSMSYNIPDNNGGVLTFSTLTVRNNCTQLTKTVSGVSGVISTGSQWCN
jgi:hypothetical protein